MMANGECSRTESATSILQDIPPRPFPTYDTLSYPDFLDQHLRPNTPFLLSRGTASWPAKEWGIPPSDKAASRPNLAALRAYADHVVPVANTSKREFSEFERDELPLGSILGLWDRGEGRELYVKDWHLFAELEARGGHGRQVYSPPECFRDDWLSPPFEDSSAITSTSASASTADFRFVYCGPEGTFTPIHRDVYGSYSWSANVVGRKVWWLFPPGTESRLVDPDPSRGELLFDVRGLPEEQLAVKILQEEGEVIFVPSGWHHQVVNIDFCISINHNFFSSPTLSRIYRTLRASQARVEASISDVKGDIRSRLGDSRLPDGTPAWEAEWAQEVESLLARDAGWGWEGFWSCVRDNVQRPPTIQELSPPIARRNAFVREVLELYKTSKEWTLLPAAKEIALNVERLINTA